MGCLVHELRLRGLATSTEVPLALRYKGIHVHAGDRLDIVVDDAVVVELKTVERFKPEHEPQLLSYLRLSGKRVGLLVNFHVPTLKDGIKCLVL